MAKSDPDSPNSLFKTDEIIETPALGFGRVFGGRVGRFRRGAQGPVHVAARVAGGAGAPKFHTSIWNFSDAI